jgi:hypothetical protein
VGDETVGDFEGVTTESITGNNFVGKENNR